MYDGPPQEVDTECTYLPLVLHDGAQVRYLVPWGSCRVDDHSVISSRRGEDVGGEARRLVLEDDLPREVQLVLSESCTGMEGKQIGNMVVLLEGLAVCTATMSIGSLVGVRNTHGDDKGSPSS